MNQSQQTGFQTVIQDLASFQSKSGGFSALVGEQPTLEATADALFIASIYGLLDKVRTMVIQHCCLYIDQPKGKKTCHTQTHHLRS